MTDEERALKIVLSEDEMDGQKTARLAVLIAAAFAAIREDCAKVAEEWGDTCTDYEVNKYLREVAQAIRTGP